MENFLFSNCNELLRVSMARYVKLMFVVNQLNIFVLEKY